MMVPSPDDLDGVSAGLGALGTLGGGGGLLLMWRWLLGHARASQQDLNGMMLARIQALEARDEKRQDEITSLLSQRADMERAHADRVDALRERVVELERGGDAQARLIEELRAESSTQRARIVELEEELKRSNGRVERMRAERRGLGLSDGESEAIG